MKKDTYQKITQARELLELPEEATMEEIKSNYRKLLGKWHPDKSHKNQEECHEMTQKIITAYKIITNCCHHYQYSFSEKEIRKYISDEEWWCQLPSLNKFEKGLAKVS